MVQTALEELQALKSAGKLRGALQGAERYVAAHLLAQGHTFKDVAVHYNVPTPNLWRMIPQRLIVAAKEEQAALTAAGKNVPAVPAIKKTTPERMMSAHDIYVASHLRAQGYHISDVAAHYGMSESGFNKQVTSTMKQAAKAEQADLAARGIPLPELPRIKTDVSARRKAGLLSRNADKRQALKKVKDHERSLAATQRKKRQRERNRYQAARKLLALQLVASGEDVRDVARHMGKTASTIMRYAPPEEVTVLKAEWAALQRAGKPLPELPEIERTAVTESVPHSTKPKLTAQNCFTAAHLLASGKQVDQVAKYYGVRPVNLWMQLAVKLVEPIKAERAALIAAGKQLPPLPKLPELKFKTKAADKLCIAVPLSAVTSRSGLVPPECTPQDLWQGFVAHNRALHGEWRNTSQRNNLFDLLLPRFGVARLTPEAMMAMGPEEFLRQQKKEQLRGGTREVFLLLSKKSKQVVGELWHDTFKDAERNGVLHVVSARPKSSQPSPSHIFMDIGGRREQTATQLVRRQVQAGLPQGYGLIL